MEPREKYQMPVQIKEVMDRYIKIMKEIYGIHLKKIILYGSYARGDFREDSDVDVMILVDLNDEEIRMRRRLLSDATFDFSYDDEVEIMPIVKNLDFFYRWIGASPFYNNVNNEGVELYAA